MKISRNNKSHLIFFLSNIITVLLFNTDVLKDWLTKFLITLWLLAIGLLLFSMVILIKKFISVKYYPISTYLLIYVFAIIFIASIGATDTAFFDRLKQLVIDPEVYYRLALPYVISVGASWLFYKYGHRLQSKTAA